MGDYQAGQSIYVLILAGITIISCVILHYLSTIFFGNKKKESLEHEKERELGTNSDETSNDAAPTETRPSAKSKKRATWKGKTEFSHPWLLKNLKGHPGTVLLVDFSANGKFMAATCDDVLPSVGPAGAATRRRKPRDQRCSPIAATATSASQRYVIEKLAEALRPYLLSTKKLWALGYPLELDPTSTKAVVYINPPLRPRPMTTWDVNAPVFVPGSQGDSGRGSFGSNTPPSDSDEEADLVEHLCVRCDKIFRMTRDGEYIHEESCTYHWGRLSCDSRYACCNKVYGSKGCSLNRYHVWNGTRPGMNGPLDGYVRARSRRGGIYAIDTEMCYTTAGLELASIAVIAADGRVVYRTLVTPNSQVLDYNTRFSGIKSRDLTRATKTLRDVQNDILGFVGVDTILVGHALDNDLRALKLLHTAIVDTCDLYPHPRGFPFRRSLRALSEELLGRSVQQGTGGHSPIEDARAAMDLVLLKVQQDRAFQARNTHQMHMLQPYDPLICAA